MERNDALELFSHIQPAIHAMRAMGRIEYTEPEAEAYRQVLLDMRRLLYQMRNVVVLSACAGPDDAAQFIEEAGGLYNARTLQLREEADISLMFDEIIKNA